MNVLLKSKSIPFWSLIPVALGLHGLMLCIPIALEEPVPEKQNSAPVKLQKLPPSKVSALPKPKLSPSPASAIAPPVPIPNSSALTISQPIASTAAQKTAPQATPSAQTAPPIQATPPIQPTPPTQTPPAVTPEKVSDLFQIAGAVACPKTQNCYSTADTTGVTVADQVITNLNKKGYNTKERADLTFDQPMKIYEIQKDPQKPVEYLHIIWGNGKGTRTLTLTRTVVDWDELAAIAQL